MKTYKQTKWLSNKNKKKKKRAYERQFHEINAVTTKKKYSIIDKVVGISELLGAP